MLWQWCSQRLVHPWELLPRDKWQLQTNRQEWSLLPKQDILKCTDLCTTVLKMPQTQNVFSVTCYLVVGITKNKKILQSKQSVIYVRHCVAMVTSGTCRCRWELTRKTFSGSLFIRKALAKVEAIFALSFITSPSWPADEHERIQYAFCLGKISEQCVMNLWPKGWLSSRPFWLTCDLQWPFSFRVSSSRGTAQWRLDEQRRPT